MLEILLITDHNDEQNMCSYGSHMISSADVLSENWQETIAQRTDLTEVLKGVSLAKALNSGMRNLSEDICLITNQQVQLYPDFKEIITEAHSQFKESDIIAFQLNSTKDIAIAHSHYSKADKPHEQIINLKYYEISFKKSILDNKIGFGEDFGAGAVFPFGESYAFVQQAREKGLKIHFSTSVIGQHPERYQYRPVDEVNRLQSLGALDCKFYGWNYVINYLNVSIKKMEKRETLYGDGLLQLNKLNAYLIGAKKFSDQFNNGINL